MKTLILLMLLTVSGMCGTVRLHLNGGVTRTWVTRTHQAVKQAQETKSKVIKVTIYSGGGDVDAATQVRNLLKASNAKIICDTKKAESAAFYIFLVCDERIIYPKTSLMWHQIKYNLYNSQSYRQLKSHAYQLEARNKIVITIIAAATKYTWDYIWNKIDYKDWYIPPIEALRNGVATKIERKKK